jgi:hypothetical protein
LVVGVQVVVDVIVVEVEQLRYVQGICGGE